VGPAILGALSCACGGGGPWPRDFVFGTSTAGFQVEMGCPTVLATECEDAHSDWYAFITSTDEALSKLHNEDGPAQGPGHYELFEADFDRASRELGTNALRLSLEWSRLFPTETDGVEGYESLRAIASPTALAHYHAVLSALRVRGLKPFVTLNHYTLPAWLHDGVGCHLSLKSCTRKGWLDKDRAVREAAKYAAFAAREFGGDVDVWSTLNEPISIVVSGYLMPNADRVNPPALLLRFDEAKAVFGALVEAHARMYDAVKQWDQEDADGDGRASDVGLVFAFTPAAPKNPDSKLDQRAAEDVFYLWNLAYLNAVTKGDFDADLDGTAEHRDDLADRMDYLGINYYTRVTVEGMGESVFPDFSPRTRFDPFTLNVWEDYPRGLYEMAMVAQSLGVPAYVTENGKDDPKDDGTGSDFLVRHLQWLERARRDGADVRGYFYWTLVDNFEWNHGMDVRMGLYAVSKTDPLKARVARQSVGTYGDIIRRRGISRELADRYPEPE
jgi:beta-galactosidase